MSSEDEGKVREEDSKHQEESKAGSGRVHAPSKQKSRNNANDKVRAVEMK